jgi:hypothetical protein
VLFSIYIKMYTHTTTYDICRHTKNSHQCHVYGTYCTSSFFCMVIQNDVLAIFLLSLCIDGMATLVNVNVFCPL